MAADFTNYGVAIYAQADANYAGATGYWTDIAVSSDARDHIAFYDPHANFGVSPEVQYTRLDVDLSELVWSEKVGDKGGYTSIALTSTDTPCVAWQDSTDADLMYGCRSGSTWSEETVDSTGSVGAWAALALDSGDRPWIAYYDETNMDLKVAHDDGAGWTTMTVDDAGDVGLAPTITIDAWDDVHITYYDQTNGFLKYAEGQ